MNPDDIDKAVQALKSQGAPDEAIHAYLQSHLGAPIETAPQGHDYHAEFKSGALQKRMAGANARDVANASEEDAAQPGYFDRAATHVLNTGQGIPGVEAVEAGAGALGSHLPLIGTDKPLSYRESLQTLRGNTANIGGKTSMGEHMLGSLATLPFLPASPVAAGALVGGADQLLDADPDHGIARRAIGTVAGATGGALLGRAGQSVTTGVRALLTKGPAANMLERQLARAASAKELYSASLGANPTGPLPDQVRTFLAHEDIAPIADRLQSMDLNLKPDSPELLDAIYKTLSDQSAAVKKGLSQVDPVKGNMGRFTEKHINALKQKFIAATSQPGTIAGVPTSPPLPGYGEAVDDFARQSADLSAVRRGLAAKRTSLVSGIPSDKRLLQDSPEALARWAEKSGTTDAEKAAAVEGILGGTKLTMGGTPMGIVKRSLGGDPFGVGSTPSLLREVNTPQQRAIDMLVKAGLVPSITAAPQLAHDMLVKAGLASANATTQ